MARAGEDFPQHVEVPGGCQGCSLETRCRWSRVRIPLQPALTSSLFRSSRLQYIVVVCCCCCCSYWYYYYYYCCYHHYHRHLLSYHHHHHHHHCHYGGCCYHYCCCCCWGRERGERGGGGRASGKPSAPRAGEFRDKTRAYPRRRNVTTSMVGLKIRSRTQKSHPQW